MSSLKLTIAEPCHQQWQMMNVVDQGRFCDSCRKTVTDFTGMENDEVYRFLLNSDADICGRLSAAQLQKEFRLPNSERSGWKKYLLGFVFPVFFLARDAKAQVGKVKLPCTLKRQLNVKKLPGFNIPRSFELSGRVIDATDDSPVAHAIIITTTNTGRVLADSNGSFKLSGQISDSIDISISALGFKNRQMAIAIPLDGFTMNDVTIPLNRDEIILPDVVVNAGSQCQLSGIMGGISLSVAVNRVEEFKKRVLTVLNDSIKIYPNPVQRGEAFNVRLSLSSTGKHTMQVLDMSGRIMLQQPVQAVEKLYTANINAGATWPAGEYTLRVVGNNNKLQGVKRFVVK